MSATPETDAAVHASGGDWSPVLRETCRRLERERDHAKRQFENIKAISIHTCHDQCQRPMCVLRRERDEARAVAYDLASIASHCLGWHDHESSEAAERISETLKRWKSAQPCKK